MTAEEKAAELYPYAATGTIHWAQQILKQQGFLSGANWKESQHEWVACEERLPTQKDTVDGLVEVIRYKDRTGKWLHYQISVECENLFEYDYWRTPFPNNFPPPKTEI
jgi:hypothetical protein